MSENPSSLYGLFRAVLLYPKNLYINRANPDEFKIL